MRWSERAVLDDGAGAAPPGAAGRRPPAGAPAPVDPGSLAGAARSTPDRWRERPPASPRPTEPRAACSDACVHCLAGPTRVLLADGRTRPIAELRVGDAVVGTELVDGRRRYVRTTVLAHWSAARPAVRLRLADGTEIIASGEHRFLSAEGWRHVTGGWCRSGRRPHLRPGSALLGPGPFGAPPPSGPSGPADAAGPTAADRAPGAPVGRHPAGRGRGRPTGPALASARGRSHSAEYRRGYLCGLVRADRGPALDRVFPSAQLELEALGRAHHFLADLPAVPVPAPVSAVRCEPVAARGRTRWSPAGPVPSAGAHPVAELHRRAAEPPPAAPRTAADDGGAARWPVGGHDDPAPPAVAEVDPLARSAGWAGARAAAEPGRVAPPVAGPRPVVDAVRWPERPDDEWCAGFLAGVVDARGTLRDGVLRVHHHDEAVVGRVVGALHRFGLGFAVEPGGPGEHGGVRTVRLLGGPPALLRLLRLADPAVSRCRDLEGADVTAVPPLRVVAVEPLGVDLPLHDITTGTGDFVAEGVVSHNCSARHSAGARGRW
jgi:hypothetical protein